MTPPAHCPGDGAAQYVFCRTAAALSPGQGGNRCGPGKRSCAQFRSRAPKLPRRMTKFEIPPAVRGGKAVTERARPGLHHHWIKSGTGFPRPSAACRTATCCPAPFIVCSRHEARLRQWWGPPLPLQLFSAPRGCPWRVREGTTDFLGILGMRRWRDCGQTRIRRAYRS
jgi:hypothetical protein